MNRAEIKQPTVITYNLKDRGRKYQGKERNFNIKAICDAINSPYTQEKVKTRGMLGYFGHNPRILAGMEPGESIVINGRYNEIEPAIVTTELSCDYDGNVTHKTEFLDTVSGRKAARMNASRIGGFSSAIDETRPEFYGFDYVLQPNFSHNRSYSLDSVSGLTLDDVVRQCQDEETEFWLSLLEAKDRQINAISHSLDSLSIENEQLLSILASKKPDMALDSAAVKPLLVDLDSVNRLRNDRDLFRRSAHLPAFVEPASQSAEAIDSYRELKTKMGI
jgi:hypothetical protein